MDPLTPKMTSPTTAPTSGGDSTSHSHRITQNLNSSPPPPFAQFLASAASPGRVRLPDGPSVESLSKRRRGKTTAAGASDQNARVAVVSHKNRAPLPSPFQLAQQARENERARVETLKTALAGVSNTADLRTVMQDGELDDAAQLFVALYSEQKNLPVVPNTPAGHNSDGLAAGAVLNALRGEEQEGVTLQVISLDPTSKPTTSDGATDTCTFVVSDGTFTVKARAPADDWDDIYSAGVNGIIAANSAKAMDRSTILLVGVAECQKGGQRIGAPEGFDLLPPRPIPGSYRKSFPGLTDSNVYRFVAPHECNGECEHIVVDNEEIGTASPASASNGRCVMEHWPLKDFDNIKGVDRGLDRALEAPDPATGMHTNRQKRYCYYYDYARTVYSVRGACNRATLPLCVVTSIRTAYPNRKDEPYSTE